MFMITFLLVDLMTRLFGKFRELSKFADNYY